MDDRINEALNYKFLAMCNRELMIPGEARKNFGLALERLQALAKESLSGVNKTRAEGGIDSIGRALAALDQQVPSSSVQFCK